MNRETAEAILDKLGTSFKDVVETITPAIAIEGIFMSACAIFIFAIGVAGVVLMYRSLRHDNDPTKFGVMGFILFVCTILSFAGLSEGLPKALYPEAAASIQILHSLKP